ncbi:hypothetical protein [Mesoaciditoga lauensis]|uniref:hypothetical protein n=1 Tax=Mesoaciditoga lauensis TaxID=1495039 RepID=UPI00055C507F|nr:hypothetical protein [Mesoaciditoga lauensis]
MNSDEKKLVLSSLPKTWIIDIDGVLFKHNGYKDINDMNSNIEKPLPGVIEFFNKIPKNDFIIIVSSREEKYRFITEKSLKENGLRYNILIMDMPVGERILINDEKPSGLRTAYCVNLKRNEGLKINFVINSNK